MFAHLLRDAARYLVALLVPALVEIARVPIVTRLLGPAEYGRYVLVVGAAMLLATLAVAWLSAAVVRFLPEESAENAGIVARTAVRAGVVSILALGLTATLTVTLTRAYLPVDAGVAYLAIAYFATLSADRLFLGLARGQRRVNWYLAYSAVQAVAGLGFGVGLVVLTGLQISGLLLGLALATGVFLPLAWWGAARRQPSPQDRREVVGVDSTDSSLIGHRSSLTTQFLLYGLPVAGINVSTWVLSASDRYLLEAFRGSLEVGMYAASYNLAERTIFLFTSVLSLAATPLAFQLWARLGMGNTQRFMTQLTRLYLVVALPATISLSALSRPLADLLLPADYAAAFPIIPLVATGAFALGLANVYTEAFTLKLRTGRLLLCYAAAGAVNLGLNLLLIPRFGYPAAALATLVGYAGFLAITVWGARTLLPWSFPLASLLRAGAAGLALLVVLLAGQGIVATVSWPAVIGLALVGSLVYAAVLLATGEVRPSEGRALLMQLWSNRGAT